ncbi:MAG: SLC26A/SulP transporter family protein [Magnetococcales bacterium]|nr:SLC26A/SulP transporter family protein [Magnetococcales bacterium]
MEKTPANALIGDFWGGLAAMLVALPSAIAYGVVAYTPLGSDYFGYGAMAGVLGTVAIGLIAPVIGGAPRLISAPCAPAAAVLSALAGELLAGRSGVGAVTPEQILLLITVVALISGLLQLAYGAIGAGRLIKFIPFPVVSGYLSGVGTLIFLGQIPKLLGLPKGTDPWKGVLNPALWQTTAIIVGVMTMIGMVLAPRITNKLPGPIIGLLTGMSAYFFLGTLHPELNHLQGNPLLIGAIDLDLASMGSGMQARWSAVSQLAISDILALLVPMITLSVLLSIDTLKTCVVMDALTRSRHHSNRELIAQGAANFASAIVGGMPGAGTMGATLVNLNSGACTRISGVIEGVFALVALVALSWLIAWVPISALAGILIVVAYRMVDWHSFQLLRHRSTILDFLVIAAVVFVAVRFNLIAASGTGIMLAIVLFLREQIRGSVMRRKVRGDQISSRRNRLPEEKEVLATAGADTTLCELHGNLFFGTTDQLFTGLEEEIKKCHYLILDMHWVQSIDFTAVHILEQIETMLRERKAYLLFSRLPEELPACAALQRHFAHVGRAGNNEVDPGFFPSVDTALEWVENRILEQHQFASTKDARLLELHEISPFRGFDDEEDVLELLRGSVGEQSYKGGEFIFRQGDSDEKIFLIRRGSVRIVLPLDRGRQHTLAIFGRGNFFGEMAFIDHGTRSADAIADGETDIYVLSRYRFNKLIEQHPVLGHKVFARLARAMAIRLRYTNAELLVLQSS